MSLKNKKSLIEITYCIMIFYFINLLIFGFLKTFI